MRPKDWNLFFEDEVEHIAVVKEPRQLHHVHLLQMVVIHQSQRQLECEHLTRVKIDACDDLIHSLGVAGGTRMLA